MIDESLKSGPLPEVVEVRFCTLGAWRKRRPIAYDAVLNCMVVASSDNDGNEYGGYDAAKEARPVPPRVPTDEDAKRRPGVRVRDCGSSKWSEGRTLIYVRNDDYSFVTVTKEGCVTSWRFCELIE